MDRLLLEDADLFRFIAHLVACKTVYAPQRKGADSYVFAPVDDPQAVVLDYPRTLHSIKKYFLPPREELLSFNLRSNAFAAAEVEPVNAIFLGVHSYDLHAVLKLDHNFSQGNAERNYLTRRQGAIFIGVSYRPDRFHFGGSVGIPVADTTGCDLFLHRLDRGHVVEIVSDTGRELLRGLDLPAFTGELPRTADFEQHIYLPQGKLTEVFARGYQSGIWEEVAEKCVGCGTCNLVCPTCYCFNVEDEVDVSLEGGSRQRHWDGCMLREFSQVAGGEVFRNNLAARQRHRVYRKFKYISDQTGEPWCVGCGRCTAYCTAGISIVNIVNRLVQEHDWANAAKL